MYVEYVLLTLNVSGLIKSFPKAFDDRVPRTALQDDPHPLGPSLLRRRGMHSNRCGGHHTEKTADLHKRNSRIETLTAVCACASHEPLTRPDAGDQRKLISACGGTSVAGTKPTWRDKSRMSAFGGKADIV